jgi:queuosine precursor transporter
MNCSEINTQNRHDFQSKYYSIFLVLFSSTWIISVISAVKTVSFFGITLTGSFFIFPITAILNSLIVDIYGFRGARQAIWCGTIVNLSYFLFINLVNLMPASPHWNLEHEFRAIFIPQTRIIMGSIIGFWISSFLNSYLMVKLKIRGNGLFFRIFISAYISLSLDIFIFFVISFVGIIPFKLLRKIFLFAYFKKIIFEIALLPLIWKLIDIFKRLEGFEINDTNTNFTPFSLGNVYYLNNYKCLKKVQGLN